MNDKTTTNKGLIVAAAILVIAGIAVAIYALSSGGDEAARTSDPEASTQDVPSTSTTDSPQAVSDGTERTENPTIVFKDDGFEQQTYTFPAGTAITVRNDSSMDMQFSSDDHPTHREHTELNMKVLGEGESGTFTPAGKGTYKFHDHINDQFEGTLVIE